MLNNELKVQIKIIGTHFVETVSDSELQPQITTSRRTCSNTYFARQSK